MVPEGALDRIARVCCQNLTQAVEAMAGEPPQTSVTRCSVPEAQDDGAVWHRYRLNLSPGSDILAGASAASSSGIGAQILKAAGVDDPAPEDAEGTYLEILNQAISGVVRMLSGEVGREVTTEAPVQAPPPASAAQTFLVAVRIGGEDYPITINFSEELEAFLSTPHPSEQPPERRAPPVETTHNGRSIDLLLDVELPVSVSFGHAQLLLKDVLKLTTGSIVELNRSVSEPVEVIVNNCVIARGEVVVVEGNFGVRIRQVMSRQERLRNLK